MKQLKIFLKILISAVLCFAVFMLTLGISTLVIGLTYDSKNIKYQNNHLEYLKNEYYTEEYMPCNEQRLADFDLEKAMTDEVRINEIAVIGTHNSYQLLTYTPRRIISKILKHTHIVKIRDKSDFEMDTLTEQLEQGVRNLEIDIETVDDNGSVSFIVTHDPLIDNVSSCHDFSKCLEEIALWSDHNPGHIPVYLLIEPKGDVPEIKNMKNFSAEYALEFDKVIREVLGDRLLTPDDAMGEYESFGEMRKADGWPTLKESAGKIIVILHPCSITEDYINTDPSIRTQAMFPALRFGDADRPCTSFILENNPSDAVKNNTIAVDEKRIMVRTRADDYPDFSEERYAATDVCRSHIITTDYPPRSVRESEHTYSFDGYMFKLIK